MNDLLIKAGGGDRAVARALTAIAAATPTRPIQPATTPVRDASSADVATAGTLSARLAAKPPVDADRIAQIKKAVANGTFPILPATIADRLLAVRYEWMSDDRQA